MIRKISKFISKRDTRNFRNLETQKNLRNFRNFRSPKTPRNRKFRNIRKFRKNKTTNVNIIKSDYLDEKFGGIDKSVGLLMVPVYAYLVVIVLPRVFTLAKEIYSYL